MALGLRLLSAVAPRQSRSGYAANFEDARASFESAWREYLPQCTEADFAEY
jgi:hypothetical protein